MKQVVQNLKNGKTEVVNTPIPPVRPDFLLIKTAASLVSAGTERNLVRFGEKNLLGKVCSRPDLLNQALNKAKKEGVLSTLESAMNRLDQPLLLGYSSTGTVLEVGRGVDGFQPGDRIACSGGGHAVHAEYALIPKNLAAKLPENVDFESAAFTTIGAIALNGIRLASPQIGENVAIIGLGLLGLITAQLIQANGCFVQGADINPTRIQFAQGLGLSASTNSEIQQNYLSISRGRGFDHVLICADTPSDDTVELAGTIARDRGSVISLGVVGLDLPRKIYYEKELAFRVSRSSGPGRYDLDYEERGMDYPLGYVRWTEGRNLEAFLELVSTERLDPRALITHRFPIADAEKAYDLITGKFDEAYLGVLLLYDQETGTPQTKIHFPVQDASRKTTAADIHLGVVGAGNYASAVFLPKVRRAGGVYLESITSASGISARHAANKFGFSKVVSKVEEIIEDSSINTIAILTRHNSHANLTLHALQNGKNVFCEKPLGIHKDEIGKIQELLEKKEHPYLMVGFNRRFAPLAKELKEFFKGRREPMHLQYRINAGYLPPTHWLQDADIGGGRLIGEGCHFIDFAAFMIGTQPVEIQALTLPNEGIYSNDNIQITLRFEDGSIGNIQYLSNGSKVLPKEYIEVFCGGKTGILNDFRKLELFGSEKKQVFRSYFRQEKGHLNLWKAFVDTIKEGLESPIPTQELLLVSYTVLAADLALRSGGSIKIAEFIQSG